MGGSKTLLTYYGHCDHSLRNLKKAGKSRGIFDRAENYRKIPTPWGRIRPENPRKTPTLSRGNPQVNPQVPGVRGVGITTDYRMTLLVHTNATLCNSIDSLAAPSQVFGEIVASTVVISSVSPHNHNRDLSSD